MEEELYDCPCLMKKDMENAENILAFLCENYSLEGFMEQLDQLSSRDLKCAYCLLEVARQKVEKKDILYDIVEVEKLMIVYSAVAETYILAETISEGVGGKLKNKLKKLLQRYHG